MLSGEEVQSYFWCTVAQVPNGVEALAPFSVIQLKRLANAMPATTNTINFGSVALEVNRFLQPAARDCDRPPATVV